MSDPNGFQRRLNDPRIDKIDHDVSSLAANVSGLATSVALVTQGTGFVQETVKRLEAGQASIAADVAQIKEAALFSASDPLATAAGRATASRVTASEADIANLETWREGFTKEIQGTLRTLKFFATIIGLAGTALSIVAIVRTLT